MHQDAEGEKEGITGNTKGCASRAKEDAGRSGTSGPLRSSAFHQFPHWNCKHPDLLFGEDIRHFPKRYLLFLTCFPTLCMYET